LNSQIPNIQQLFVRPQEALALIIGLMSLISSFPLFLYLFFRVLPLIPLSSPNIQKALTYPTFMTFQSPKSYLSAFFPFVSPFLKLT